MYVRSQMSLPLFFFFFSLFFFYMLFIVVVFELRLVQTFVNMFGLFVWILVSEPVYTMDAPLRSISLPLEMRPKYMTVGIRLIKN